MVSKYRKVQKYATYKFTKNEQTFLENPKTIVQKEIKEAFHKSNFTEKMTAKFTEKFIKTSNKNFLQIILRKS